MYVFELEDFGLFTVYPWLVIILNYAISQRKNQVKWDYYYFEAFLTEIK